MIDILPLLRILEYYLLTAMGLSIIVISIMLYRAGFYRPSALCFILGGLFAYLWKFIFLVFGETDLTRAVSESFESSFALFTALGVLFYISHLYAEYSKRLESTLDEKSESEKRYRLLFDVMPVGIGIADIEGNVLDANKSIQEMSGYSLDELKCAGVGATYVDKEERLLLLKTLRDTGRVRDQEVRLKRKDGTIYLALLNLDLVELGGKKVLLTTARDITLPKQQEKELGNAIEKAQNEKNKSEAIIAALGDGIIIQDLNYKVIYQNHIQKELYGDKTGEYCYKAYENRDTICEDCPVEKTFIDGKIHMSERRVVSDKGVSYYDLTSSPLKDSSGKIFAGIKVVRDITERRRTEEALRESEEKYRMLIENIQDGAFIIQTAKMQYVNEAFAGMTGYKVGEVIGKDFREFIVEEDKELVTGRYYKRQSGENVPEDYDFRILRKDRSNITVNMKVGLINYRGKVASMGIIRDITERKRIEEKLRKGEQFLESIFASIQDGIGIIDSDMNIIRVNRTAETWYPHAVPLVGKKCYEAYHNRKERCELCPAWETLKTGKLANNVVPKHGQEGNIIGWLEIYSYPLKDATTGQMRGVIEYVRDISERKKVETALLESETRYRTLFESAPDAIFIVEAEGEKIGHIVATNVAAARMHGYSKDELLAMNIKDLDTEESSKEAEGIMRRILEGEIIKTEMDHRRKDKTVFPVEISGGLIEFGGHKYILGFDRDITKRKQAEEALHLSNLVVENSLTVLFRWKAQDGWPVEYVSNNVVQFGYKPEEFLSGALLYASIIYLDDIEKVSKEVEEHSKNGDDRFQQEYRIVAKNGAIRWIDDRTVIERNRDGQITHYQGIIIDITERKHTEEAIIEYNLKLEESNHMKELFTDIMHHDLLNPLNVANGYVELFLEDEPNVQKKMYLGSIKRNLVRGMELIDNAMKLSKLESMDRIELYDLDLTMVIGEIIENLTPMAVKAGMNIENNMNGRLPVRANRMIGEIFENLIANAIKYASQGKRIVVTAKDGGNSWLIRVMDFGAGIKDADKKLLFNRFQRQEKKGVKGSGLGLAIAGRITRLHNGRIWVEDNPDGGAVFVVEIQKS